MLAHDVFPKTMGSILLAIIIVSALPHPADADPPRATQAKLAEVQGSKKDKKRRTWTAHGFASWTRRHPGTAFAPLPAGARRTAAEIAVATAREQLGKPYRWGGSGPSSFDCSGLTRFAWAAAGVHLPHSSRAQYASLRRVPVGKLQPGDVVYRPGHVGIYIGRGRMIHSPESGRDVEIAPISRVIGGGRPE